MSLVSVVFCPQHSSFREPKPNACDAVLPTNSSCGQELWLDISQNAPLNMGRWGNGLEHASGASNIAALTLKLYEVMKQSKMNSAVKMSSETKHVTVAVAGDNTLLTGHTNTRFLCWKYCHAAMPLNSVKKNVGNSLTHDETSMPQYANISKRLKIQSSKDSFPVVWAVCSSVTTYDVLSSETSRFACRSSWRRNLSPVTVKSVQIELHGLGAECRALFFH